MKTQQQDNAAGRGRLDGRAPRRRKATSALIGTWHILELGLWMREGTGRERQATITVRPGGRGEFRLGPVEGSLEGTFISTPGGTLFDFTWKGLDGAHPLSGRGWIRIKVAKAAEGTIKSRAGDVWGFTARKAA